MAPRNLCPSFARGKESSLACCSPMIKQWSFRDAILQLNSIDPNVIKKFAEGRAQGDCKKNLLTTNSL